MQLLPSPPGLRLPLLAARQPAPATDSKTQVKYHVWAPLQRTYQKPCLSHTHHPSVQDVEVRVQGSTWTAIGDPVSKGRRKSRRKKRRNRNTEGDPGKPPSYLDPKRGWRAMQWASSKCLKSLRNRKLSELWWMSRLRSKVHEGCKKLDVAWYH